jgi:hypothetical protein
LQERDRLADYRICDVNYIEVRRDPIAAVRRIYGHFGWLLSAEAAQRMRLVLANQPQDQYGRHRYNLSQFGILDVESAAPFAAYCDRFGLSAQGVRRSSGRAEELVWK